MIHIGKDWLPCNKGIPEHTIYTHPEYIVNRDVEVGLRMCKDDLRSYIFKKTQQVKMKRGVLCEFETLYSSYAHSIYIYTNDGCVRLYNIGRGLESDNHYYVFVGSMYFDVVRSGYLHPDDAQLLAGYDLVERHQGSLVIRDDLNQYTVRLKGNRIRTEDIPK